MESINEIMKVQVSK